MFVCLDSCQIQVDGQDEQFEIIDTTRAWIIDSQLVAWIPEANGFLLVYDMDSVASFDYCKQQLESIKYIKQQIKDDQEKSDNYGLVLLTIRTKSSSSGDCDDVGDLPANSSSSGGTKSRMARPRLRTRPRRWGSKSDRHVDQLETKGLDTV